MDPYAPPRTAVSEVRDDPQGHYATREKFLRHESALRSVAFFYYLAGIPMGFLAVIIISTIMIRMATTYRAPDLIGAIALFGVSLSVSVVMLATARGMRTLKHWIRLPVGLISGVGLLVFPLGTLANAYILYLVFSRKGHMVLSAPYREVIANTPEIKPGTPVLMWSILAALLGLLAIAVFDAWSPWALW